MTCCDGIEYIRITADGETVDHVCTRGVTPERRGRGVTAAVVATSALVLIVALLAVVVGAVLLAASWVDEWHDGLLDARLLFAGGVIVGLIAWVLWAKSGVR